MARASVAFLLLLSLAARGFSEELIPLLAWSNQGAFSSVAVDDPTGRNKVDLTTLVQQAKFEELSFVFVFRTDKLSFDDIAKYGGVYGSEFSALSNIQSEMASSSSTVWGGAEGTVASLLIEGIAEKLDMSPKYITGMEDVAVVFGQPQLLVVDLPYGDSEAEFAQQDSMVAEVLEAVHHLDATYAAFYTAMMSEAELESNTYYAPLLAKRDSPNLMTSSGICEVAYGVQDDEETYCALFCLSNATILYWESQSDLENGYSPCIANITGFNERSVSGCNSSTIGSFPSIFATLEGNCANSSGREFREDVEFTFPQGNFEPPGQRPLLAGFWQMMIVAGPYNLTRYGKEKLTGPFSIPIGSSYACRTEDTSTSHVISNPNRFLQVGNSTEDDEIIVIVGEGGPVVQFTGLHVQAYGGSYMQNDIPVFSTVVDCHGYFTLPSLMGVFISIIVLIILYVSIVFMFSNETVDRFEDPRAPTIHIDNLH